MPSHEDYRALMLYNSPQHPLKPFPLATKSRLIYEAHSEIDLDDLDVICEDSMVKFFYSLRIADLFDKVVKKLLGFDQASDPSQDNFIG